MSELNTELIFDIEYLFRKSVFAGMRYQVNSKSEEKNRCGQHKILIMLKKQWAFLLIK